LGISYCPKKILAAVLALMPSKQEAQDAQYIGNACGHFCRRQEYLAAAGGGSVEESGGQHFKQKQ
jgi:hypothetical protein